MEDRSSPTNQADQPVGNRPQDRPSQTPGEGFNELPVGDNSWGDGVVKPTKIGTIDDMQENPDHIIDMLPRRRVP